MSGHSPIRQDKTCLNCRHVVAERFCPNCGQENTDSRKTFHHLFIHFFEDLTHYENAFWKTIKNLLFKPGSLTKAYLSGKRLSYLAPVRLYIFISFVTFLLIGILSRKSEHSETYVASQSEAAAKEMLSSRMEKREHVKTADDSLADQGKVLAIKDGKFVFVDADSAAIPDPKNANHAKKDAEDEAEVDTNFGFFKMSKYKGLKAYDSIQASLPEAKRDKGFRHWMYRSLISINEKSKTKTFRENYLDAFVHNIPKALFLYMPIFAFWLWVFHGKKRWFYFDHGIFTLHYFSFMLLTICIMFCFDSFADWTGAEWLSDTVSFLWFITLCWWFFYFFRSHSRFYGERKAISRLKSLALYVINMWLLTFFTLALFMYTALNMH